MTENFINLVKEKDTQVQEDQRVPNKLDPKKLKLRYIIIKRTKLKDKGESQKQVATYREHQLNCHLITQQKHFRPEGSGVKYSR